MTDHEISIDRWAAVATAALCEVASSALGLEATTEDAARATEPGHWGSLVPLVSGTNTTCVAVSSTPEGCRLIAGAMLGMDATEAAELSHDDVRDSIGELTNILAGVIKGRLGEEDGGLTLGLPLFIEGVVEGDRRSRGRQIVCQVGEIPCVLTLLVGGEHQAAA